jgi:hypothetical protein
MQRRVRRASPLIMCRFLARAGRVPTNSKSSSSSEGLLRLQEEVDRELDSILPTKEQVQNNPSYDDYHEARRCAKLFIDNYMDTHMQELAEPTWQKAKESRRWMIAENRCVVPILTYHAMMRLHIMPCIQVCS